MAVLREIKEKSVNNLERSVDNEVKLLVGDIKYRISEEVKKIPKFPNFSVGSNDPEDLRKYKELIRPLGKEAVVIEKEGIIVHTDYNSSDVPTDYVVLLRDGLYSLKANSFNIKGNGTDWTDGHFPFWGSRIANIEGYITYRKEIFKKIRPYLGG